MQWFLFLNCLSSAFHLPSQYLLHYLCLWVSRCISAEFLKAVGGIITSGIITSAFTGPFISIFKLFKNKSPIHFFYIVCKLQVCSVSIVPLTLLCFISLSLSFPVCETIIFPVPFSCSYLKIAVLVVTTSVMQLDGPRIWRLMDNVTLWSPLWGGTEEICNSSVLKALEKVASSAKIECSARGLVWLLT